jgi:hypothetical protein
LYLDFAIDVFQGEFPLLDTNTRPIDIVGTGNDWADWTTEEALVNIAKITYFFVGFKNSTDFIKY